MNHFALLDGTPIPRSSIECIRHSSIDASLKDLRTISRRVTAFSAPYGNELQLLERIYYKGKNQHRSALFWHKVLEIRRLGTRISDMDFSRFVEDLHFAFYGTQDRKNPKILRGAWKQAPDSSWCMSLLRRLRTACLLVDQTRARFRVAHGAFTLQLRTVTFVSLAMCLVSITSRLDFLVSELREILVLLWHAVARILNTIAEMDINKYHDVSLPLDPFVLPAMTSSRAVAAQAECASKRRRVSTGTAEDFGSRVSRDSHAATTGSQIPIGSSSAVGRALLTEVNPYVNHDDPSGFMETPSSHRPMSAASLSTVPRMSCEVSEITAVLSHPKGISLRRSSGKFERRHSVQVLAGEKRKVKKVKRKTNSGEIDDIFGF